MSDRTLGTSVEDFLRFGHAGGWKTATVDHYRFCFDTMMPVLRQRGCQSVGDITRSDLCAIMDHVRAIGRAKSSRLKMAQLLQHWCAWLHDHGHIPRNPSLDLPLPDDGDPDLLEPPLAEGDIAALFAALPRHRITDLRHACFLELLYGCGLRRGEALNLNVTDIDLTQYTLHVRDGKAGQDRLLPVMTTAAAAVRDYLSVRRTLLKGPDHGALFLNYHGTRWSFESVNQFFIRLNAQRGPRARHLHPHLFRHSIAVHLLRGGADIRYIQHFLGHGDLDTTKIYLRLVPGRLKEDYDKAMPEIAVGLELPITRA